MRLAALLRKREKKQSEVVRGVEGWCVGANGGLGVRGLSPFSEGGIIFIL